MSEAAQLAVPFDREVWDAGQCAVYFKESRQEFLRTRRYSQGFPKEIPGRPRLWRALEVTNWALTGDWSKSPANYSEFPQKAA
jgi:hypothetical protein